MTTFYNVIIFHRIPQRCSIKCQENGTVTNEGGFHRTAMPNPLVGATALLFIFFLARPE